MKKYVSIAMTPIMLAMSVTLALAEPKHPPMPKQKKMPSQTQPMNRMTQQNPLTMMPSANMFIPAAMPGKAHPLMIEGKTALIHRKYGDAVKAFQDLLSSNPEHVQALNGLSIAYLNQGHYDEALNAVNKALELDPVNSRLYYTKAQVLDVQNKTADAIETYLTFSALAPNDGAALAAQGRAEELYKETLASITPTQSKYLEGLRLLSLQQPDQAIAPLEECKSMGPNNHKTELMLGCAYLQADRAEKAIPCFEAVLRMDTNSPMAYYQLGSSHQMRGDSQSAQEAFRKFVQAAPQSEMANRLNGMMKISSQH